MGVNIATPFMTIAQNGFLDEMVPIIPPNAVVSASSTLAKGTLGKIPGWYSLQKGQWTGFPWREFKAKRDDVLQWEKWPGAGLGVKTGKFVAIDIDILDPSLAFEIECAFGYKFGFAPCRTGKAPKRLLLYRLVGSPRGKITLDFKGLHNGKIEILGLGNQFVAYGTHPDTLKPYRWSKANLENILSTDLPSIDYASIELLLQEIKLSLVNKGYAVSIPGIIKNPRERVNISNDLLDQSSTIDRAIHYLRNHAPMAIENEGGDKTTYVVAAEILNMGVSEDVAFNLLAEHWNDSKAYPPWDLDELEKKVVNAATYNRSGIGSKHPSAVFSPRAMEHTTKHEPSRLMPIAWENLANLPKRQYLIKGLLDQGGMSVLYGESNCGKTFLALDLAIHITRGQKWISKRVRMGAVVYIAAEGGFGIQDRLTAFHKHHGLTEYPPLHVIPTGVDLCGSQSDVKELISEISKLPNIALIVIDTLSRAMAGGNENSPDDMGSFITNCDLLRQATGAHVMAVHHSGKDTSRGARGHSSLRAAVDTEIEVTKDGHNLVSARVRKQRDGETGSIHTFELRTLIVRKDEDGEFVTSCVLIPAQAISAQKPLSTQMQRAFETLKEMSGDDDFVSEVAFKDRLKSEGISKAGTADNVRKGIQTILNGLLSRGYIFLKDGNVGLATSEQSV